MEPRRIAFPLLTGRLLNRPMALADAEELLEVYRDAGDRPIQKWEVRS